MLAKEATGQASDAVHLRRQNSQNGKSIIPDLRETSRSSIDSAVEGLSECSNGSDSSNCLVTVNVTNIAELDDETYDNAQVGTRFNSIKKHA